MKDTPRIEGIPDPRKPDSTQSSNVDPNKFKKVMQVGESDDTQKREKRNLPKSEEEPEEEVNESIPIDGSFKNLMTEASSGDSIFTGEGGKQSVRVQNDDNPLESGPLSSPFTSSGEKIPEDSQIHIESTPSPSAPENEKIDPPIKSEEKKDSKKAFKKKTDQQEAQDIMKSQKTPAADTLSPLEKAEKTHHDRERLLETTKMQQEKSMERPLDKKQKPEKVPPLLPDEITEGQKKQEKTRHDREKLLETTKMQQEKSMERPLEKEQQPEKMPPLLPDEITEGQKKQAAKEKKDDTENTAAKQKSDQMPLDVPSMPMEGKSDAPSSVFSPSSLSETHLASLPPQVYELFSKMVGFMTIETTKGISKTTVSINMPGSIFNGTKVQLDHYDTAPHSFNIELIGHLDAVNLLNENLQNLQAQFANANLPYQIGQIKTSISRPEKDSHLIRRKRESTDSSKEEKK